MTNAEICEIIWNDISSDNIRFHTSGYHGINLKEGELVQIETFIEESAADLDIDPEDLNIPLDEIEWGRKMSDVNLIAEMCKTKFNALKQYKGFSFDEPEDWVHTIKTTEWY